MALNQSGPDYILRDSHADLMEFYRQNPVIAAEDLLNVDMDKPQKIIFESMWKSLYVLITASRGSGKTWLLSVFSTLYAMLFPGKRVLLMSPSFRQSKHIFSEVTVRYTESPILRECTIKKPITSSDNCYLHFRAPPNRQGSRVEAFPLGDGNKIRGLRGHALLCDEFAQLPESIFEIVLRPMGATNLSPMDAVRRIEKLKKSIEKGIITQEQMDEEMSGDTHNKIICVSSAYYQFNHMYKRIKAYEEQIAKGSDKYAVHSISYKDMSPGFLDENNIEEAKATMSKTEFSLEYLGVWESDSAGVFKASLIEKCKTEEAQLRLRGAEGRSYVLGVDPARSSDSFAWVIIEIGNPSFVCFAEEIVGAKFPAMAKLIYDFCEKFNVVDFHMDAGSGGGGVAIKDILASDQFSRGRLILDKEDEDHKNLTGKRILKMCVPNPKNIAASNYNTINLMEQGLLKFPLPPLDGDDEKETIYNHIKSMLTQTMSIAVTETKSGQAHFDIPATGKGSRKKDLYSAFILAANGLYERIVSRDQGVDSYVNRGGLIIPVSRGYNQAPSITSILGVPGR